LKLRRRQAVKAFPQKRSQLEVGPGFCPEYVQKAGSGIAADQTNAMLATSKGGDFLLCGRSPLFL